MEVVLVLVSVGTEVHASGDPRERTTFLQAQPAVWSFRLGQALKDTERNFVSGTQTCLKGTGVPGPVRDSWEGLTTDLVAVGLRCQLLVQWSHLGCQMLESIPEFSLLVIKKRHRPGQYGQVRSFTAL